MSPLMSVMSSTGSHLSTLDSRTRQRTRHPESTSSSTRWLPMNPVAPVTRATRLRSGTRRTDRNVVHPIRAVDPRAHFLERHPHHHVVLENPRHLGVHDTMPGAVSQHLHLDELGYS